MTLEFAGTDRYRVVRPLGAGGMGAVYEVEDLRDGSRKALKLMTALSADATVRFKREFRAIAGLRHRNLVRLHELSAHGQQVFYTMELVPGSDLAGHFAADAGAHDGGAEPSPALLTPTEILDPTLVDEVALGGTLEMQVVGVEKPPTAMRPACDPAALRVLLHQILDALEFLHGHGIIHRDIKPQNILVTPDGRVKVVDFGILKDTTDPLQTGAAGLIAGTPAYMSPEQVVADATTPATDLYCLGCVLFELLTGRLPFPGRGARVMIAHKTQPAPSVSDLVTAPRPLCDMIDGLLRKAPEDRPTISQLRTHLQLGSTAAAVGRPPLVGRDEDLTRLRASLSSTTSPLIVLTGEAGIGKTALLDELSAEVSQAGGRALHGRCYLGDAIPYPGLDAAMDQAALALSTFEADHLRPLSLTLSRATRVFPTFELVLDRARIPRRQDPEPSSSARASAFAAVAQLLGMLGEQVPLVVVVDDLQWGDSDTVDLLLELPAQLPEACRVTFLCACRDADLPLDHPVRRLLDPAQAEVVCVDALDASAVRALLAEVTGVQLPQALTEAVRKQTGGNPFLLSELAGMHREFSLDGPALPSVDHVITRRLGGLPGAARRILDVACVGGGVLEGAWLPELVELDPAEIEPALDLLIHDRILHPISAGTPAIASGGRPNLDFYSSRYRQVADDLIAAPDRGRIQGRYMALMAKHAPTGNANIPSALLRMQRVVNAHGDSFKFAVVTAEQAARQLGFARAIAGYERILLAMRDTPVDVNGDSAPRMLILAERLAGLLESTGDYARSIAVLQEALASDESDTPRPLDAFIPYDGPPEATPRQRVMLHLADSLRKTGQVEA